MHEVDPDKVRQWLEGLQHRLCQGLSEVDGGAVFQADNWRRAEGGGGCSRVLTNGALFEQAGVNFSHVLGKRLPASASARRPELGGRGFQAMGVSLVIHPENPHIPTAHANVRFLVAEKPDTEPVWWFGGGLDLTPFYPVAADVNSWHATARAACAPYGSDLYPRFKRWCDEYFWLPHRGEARGVGGLFFDDFNEGGFEHAFGLTRSVGEAFLEAYLPIVHRRHATPWTDAERAFQLYRRGRYVEFNLLFDRGTQFGIQSGGRTESILMSLPPLARWEYGYTPAPETREAALTDYWLQPRDWLASAPGPE